MVLAIDVTHANERVTAQTAEGRSRALRCAGGVLGFLGRELLPQHHQRYLLAGLLLVVGPRQQLTGTDLFEARESRAFEEGERREQLGEACLKPRQCNLLPLPLPPTPTVKRQS